MPFVVSFEYKDVSIEYVAHDIEQIVPVHRLTCTFWSEGYPFSIWDICRKVINFKLVRTLSSHSKWSTKRVFFQPCHLLLQRFIYNTCYRYIVAHELTNYNHTLIKLITQNDTPRCRHCVYWKNMQANDVRWYDPILVFYVSLNYRRVESTKPSIYRNRTSHLWLKYHVCQQRLITSTLHTQPHTLITEHPKLYITEHKN